MSAAAPALDYNALMKNLIGTVQAPSLSLPMGAATSPLVKSFVSMMNQANQANAGRGQAILGLLQGQGNAQMQQNQQNFEGQEAGIDQDMMSKGLANSTIGSNLKQGAQNYLAQNNEAVSEKSALNMADMANSFTQEGPSMDLLAKLMTGGGGGNGPQVGSGLFSAPTNAGGIGGYQGGTNAAGQMLNPMGQAAGPNGFKLTW